MRVLFQSLERQMAVREKTIGFIGLGRMGSQMAANLFSKRFAKITSTAAPPADPETFLICDAVPAASRTFASDFHAQYPEAALDVCESPAEYVVQFSLACCA